MSTQKFCESKGLDFFPMVLEQHGGGWGTEVKEVVHYVAGVIAEVWNAETVEESKKIARRFSTTLHMENARVIWDKIPEPEID